MDYSKIAKGIALGSSIAGAGIASIGPMTSLYKSGQQDRGTISTGAHFIGAGIGYGALSAGVSFGGAALASQIARKAL